MILKKFGGRAENSEGTLNSLLLEKMTELALQGESLRLEVKMLGEQKEPGGEQQSSGLVNETWNLTAG